MVTQFRRAHGELAVTPQEKMSTSRTRQWRRDSVKPGGDGGRIGGVAHSTSVMRLIPGGAPGYSPATMVSNAQARQGSRWWTRRRGARH
jgi:hypothetical protein